MKSRIPLYIKISAYTMVLFIVILFAAAIVLDSRSEKAEKLKGIGFIGTYSINGSAEQPITYDAAISPKKDEVVSFRGNFTEPINKNYRLYMALNAINVEMKINGETVFIYGNNHPSITKSDGCSWQGVVSPGISTDDEIEFIVSNPYPKRSADVIGEFLSSFSTGNNVGLFNQMISKNGHLIFLGVFAITLGLALMLITTSAYICKVKASNRMVFFSLFVISFGISILFLGNYMYMTLLIPCPTFNGIADTLCTYSGSVFILTYILSYIKSNMLKVVIAMDMLIVAMIIIFGTLQAFGIYDIIETTSIGTIIVISCDVIAFGLVVYEAIKYKNPRLQSIAISVPPFFIGSIIDTFNLFFDFMPRYLCFSAGFIIFVIVQLASVGFMIKESADTRIKAKELEAELVESKIDIMMSQIQPHFIYNSLATISALSNEPSVTRSIDQFSLFLRNNMDSLTNKNPIPFVQELEHTKNFLALELLQYGNRLKITYDIKVDSFIIPTLTLQPIVENAVKYGMRARKHLDLSISTEESESEFIVTVSDNGTGFDSNVSSDENKSHIGISNVKSRLYVQCKGELIIDSVEHEGTTIKIIIPKEIADEHTNG